MNLDIVNTPCAIKNVVKNYKNGYSPILLFCGRMRVGKTTKAYVTAQWLSHLIFGHKWDWRNNTIVTMKQLVEKMDSPKPEILLMDEVQRILGKKDLWKAESRLFDTLITSQAYKHYIIILILPKARNLGTDHAVNVNYVFPVHSRTLVMPYHVESNSWNITLKNEKLPIFPLGYFHMDVKKGILAEAFKEELLELEDFKKLIEVNLKQPIMDDAKEKVGLKEYDFPIEPLVFNKD